MRNKFISLSGIILLLIVWWLVSISGIVDSRLFPNVIDVVKSIGGLFAENKILSNILATLYRTLIGFGIASVVAIPLGLIIGSNKIIRQAAQPVVDFFRSLPGTAMFPLFLLMFGIGDGSKIAISVFIAFWVILINTVYGVLYTSQLRHLAARSFGASSWQVFRDVTFFDSLPYIVTGLRNGLALALVAVVVSEMFIGVNMGLGQKIYDSYLTYEVKDLYAWLVITGVIGFILNQVFVLVDKKWLHWANK